MSEEDEGHNGERVGWGVCAVVSAVPTKPNACFLDKYKYL